MELKLMYRWLRQVSYWVTDDYYSEVFVEGGENIPEDGPIILASTHQNEMVDIASLAITMPHRRQVLFWAKSSMFKNPVLRQIMVSCGAIPVRRNPNSLGSNGSSPASSTTLSPVSASPTPGPSKAPAASSADELHARAELFSSTVKALRDGGVIGIFPEGTSCTGWRVFQTMPGAAWAALEYTRANASGELNGEVKGKGKDRAKPKGVRIVPVAITYTDKTKYRSRIHVRYGTPILMDAYEDELFDPSVDPNVSAKSVVAKMTKDLEDRLIDLSVNAEDWETICAVKTAIEILWTDADRVPLKVWVELNQRLVSALEDHPDTKRALCKYNALLYHTSMQHKTLASLSPSSARSPLASAARSILFRLPLSTLHFAAFLPTLLYMFPAYFTGPLAARLLGNKDEDESQAQFKSCAGMLGITPNILILFNVLWKSISGSAPALSSLLSSTANIKSFLGHLVQTVGATFLGVSLIVRWHNALVKANYDNLRRLRVYTTLLRSALRNSQFLPLPAHEVEPYTRPPHPKINPYIKSKYLVDLPKQPTVPNAEKELKGGKAALVPDVVLARREAEREVGRWLERKVELRLKLEGWGAKVPNS